MTFLCDINFATNELPALSQAQGLVWFLVAKKRKRYIQNRVKPFSGFSVTMLTPSVSSK